MTIGSRRLSWLSAVTIAACMLCAIGAYIAWSALLRKIPSTGPAQSDLVDFGDWRVRHSIMDFARTAATAWPTILMTTCGPGSEETYRLTTEEPTLMPEPEHRLIEIRVANMPGGRLFHANVREYLGPRYPIEPDVPGSIPSPYSHGAKRLTLDLKDSPINFSVTTEQLAQLRDAHDTLLRSNAPLVGASHACCVDSTWVVESCVAGRYAYFARLNPDTQRPEDGQFVALRDLLLALAHRPKAL